MSSHELPLTSLPSPHPHTPCPLTSAQTSLTVSTEMVKVCFLTISTDCLRVPEKKGLEITHLSFLDSRQVHRLPWQLSLPTHWVDLGMDGLHPPVRTVEYYFFFFTRKISVTCSLFSKLDKSMHPLAESYLFFL